MLKKSHPLVFAIIALITINSCKKDSHTGQQTDIIDPAVARAKSWYESTYPINITKLSTQATTSGIDFSQHIKPDWNHADTYTRFDDNVIEMPLDAIASAKMGMSLKSEAGDHVYNSNYSRSSFLLIKQMDKYNAYIMTIIADPVYLKNDLNKLDHNKYNKRDTDFSGVVLYSTPKGKFVNGWTYSNGVITGWISTDKIGASTTQGGNKTTQSIKTNTLSQKITVCTEWYQTVSYDGVTYGPTYLGETCVTYTTGGGSSGSGGSTGGSAAGGGSGSTSPSGSPCDLQGLNSVSSGKITVNSLKTQTAVTPIGGFPPPTGNPCPTGNVTSTDVTIRNFGLDKDCLNCRVPDSRFDELLDYARSIGCTVDNPFTATVTIDGVNYKGQVTQVFNADGTLAASYFSPDVNSGPFQIGIEYTIGNKGPDGNNSSGYSSPTEFSPVFGNPSANVSGSVTYTPPHNATGTVISPTQRRSLELADDQRIINLINQEDAKDDAAANPCHGTTRNGNVKWPGTAEHWLIQFDYIASNPTALREYYVPGSSGKLNGNPGYADIANPTSGEMFEIKPFTNTGQSAGAAEVQLYVTQANALCPRVSGGGWSAGTNYGQRYLPDPKNSSNLLWSRLSSDGVIVYSSIPRNGAPKPVPVLLPENLSERLKSLLKQISLNPSTMQQQILTFLRQNPQIVPYLKGAAAAVVIATIIEDIATEGVGIADDWQSFVIARTLWRASNGIILY